MISLEDTEAVIGIDSGGIFVSYRRQDTRHVAGRLFDRLAERFGRSHVFMDVTSIEPGYDYVEAINEAVSHCAVLLALIGQNWLSAFDEQGQRRIDAPNDLVMLEVKAALDQDIRVIPLLVDGAFAPKRDDLPEMIADFTRRNCFRLDHETFDSDLGVLMDVLDRTILPDSERRTAGPSVVDACDDTGADGSTDNSQRSSTSVIRAAPDIMSTAPTRTIDMAGVAPKRAVTATLAIALSVLAVISAIMVFPRMVGSGGDAGSGASVNGASPTEIAPSTSFSTGPPPLWPEGKSPILVKDVNVEAVEDWHDTGVFVDEGQTVRIVASGQWSPFTPRLVNGRGCLDVAICSQDPNQPTNICCMPHGGLVGRIGSADPFAVGVGTLLQVSNRGELYFRINDRVQSDNSGQLTVTIQVFT